MQESTFGSGAAVDLPLEPPPAPPCKPAASRLRDWVLQGLRASVFLRIRVPSPEPSALQLVVLIAASSAFQLLASRVVVPGAAEFSLRGWLSPQWMLAPIVLLCWILFAASRGSDGQRPAVSAWYGVLVAATLPLTVAYAVYAFAWYRGWWPEEWAVAAWAFAIGMWVWQAAIAARVAGALGLRRGGQALLGLGFAATCVLNSYYFSNAQAWYPKEPRGGDAHEQRLVLSQATFEKQQEVWRNVVRHLRPHRKGVRNVYGIVFAPYGSEEVFRRESNLAASVLSERFDAAGHVIELLNHAGTTDTLPWATTENLRRAIRAVAARMDRQQDVLVIYLTSHGASNFVLAARHWPLEVQSLTPAELRKALDDAGIRNRVIAISACYSGGWIDPLATDSSLVMTAADATHTSYGCGRRSELTFFGRALWDEQLRHTHSFEQAFAAAVPVIREREIEGKKPDGFSNPQIRVGAGIRPVLAELARRLDRMEPPAAAAQ